MYVAHAWVDGYFDGAEVNHIDYNRENYSADNLEWITHNQNIKHSVNGGKYKGRCGELNPNYNNHILHDFYTANPEIAKEKLGRHGAQNGRARKVFIDSLDIIFETIGDCAQWLIDNNYTSSTVKSIRQAIITSITNHKKYLGLTFQYI